MPFDKLGSGRSPDSATSALSSDLPTHRSRPSGRAAWLILIAVVLVVQIVYVAIRWTAAEEERDYLIGDCILYEAMAASMVQDRDLDLLNQLARNDLERRNTIASGQLAYGRHGPAPKHPVLMPVVSIPFYAVAGAPGLLAFNVLSVCALLVGIAAAGGGGPGARALAVLALLTTPFLNYTYNYSPDAFASLLVVWGLAAALYSRPATAGVLLGLAIWAKLPMVMFAGLVGLGVLLTTGWRGTFRFVAGMAGPLALLAAFQWWVYGAPWITGYHRTLGLTPEGNPGVYTHESLFTEPLMRGIHGQLFDAERGLAPTAPLWLLWPLGLAVAVHARRNEPRGWIWPTVLAVGVLANFLFYAKYSPWRASHYGNRFLFPGIAWSIVLLAPLAERVVAAVRSRFGKRAEPA